MSARPTPPRGLRVLRALALATAVFVLASAAAVIWAGPVRLAAAIVDLVLFAGGSLLFLAAFGVAVGRSRSEPVSLGGTFLLSGTAPRLIRRAFFVLLAIQVVVGLAAASARPYTAVAFAVLAPMSAFGTMAWWGARYGRPAISADKADPD
jgi:hypothetical protein